MINDSRYSGMEDVVSRLKEFIEDEARSGSMDFGCITPLYVYRMWGGFVPMEDIENGLSELRGCPGKRSIFRVEKPI
jgi:hypothetical protein